MTTFKICKNILKLRGNGRISTKLKHIGGKGETKDCQYTKQNETKKYTKRNETIYKTKR